MKMIIKPKVRTHLHTTGIALYVQQQHLISNKQCSEHIVCFFNR